MPSLRQGVHGVAEWDKDDDGLPRWVGPSWSADRQAYVWHDSFNSFDETDDLVYIFDPARKAWVSRAHPSHGQRDRNLLSALAFSFPLLERHDPTRRRDELIRHRTFVRTKAGLWPSCKRDYAIYKSLLEKAQHLGGMPPGWRPDRCYLMWRYANGFREIAVVNRDLSGTGSECWLPSSGRRCAVHDLTDSQGWQDWHV